MQSSMACWRAIHTEIHAGDNDFPTNFHRHITVPPSCNSAHMNLITLITCPLAVFISAAKLAAAAIPNPSSASSGLKRNCVYYSFTSSSLKLYFLILC